MMSDGSETPPNDFPMRVQTGFSSDVSDRHNDIFFAAVKATRMPMIVTDPRQPDNPILFANRAFVAMTGYAPDELIGRNCRFLQGPETDPKAVVAESRRRRSRPAGNAPPRLLNYRRGGSDLLERAARRAGLQRRRRRSMYFFGSQVDIFAPPGCGGRPGTDPEDGGARPAPASKRRERFWVLPSRRHVVEDRRRRASRRGTSPIDEVVLQRRVAGIGVEIGRAGPAQRRARPAPPRRAARGAIGCQRCRPAASSGSCGS